ncbi:helix-turn-helix transcriptional regulator [Bradyrhizobium sp. LMG 9283]|uniref:helix-turn-helix transcriptional regulator n=1 Tax=Bradyrhizobium sp. LMG 9283 TaxID=592064 RepID=UPI00388E03D8
MSASAATELDQEPRPNAEAPRRMLSVEQVLEILPLSRTTLFRMERDGVFPPSHSISAGKRAWYADEVLAWQKALPLNNRISRRSAASGRVKGKT